MPFRFYLRIRPWLGIALVPAAATWLVAQTQTAPRRLNEPGPASVSRSLHAGYPDFSHDVAQPLRTEPHRDKRQLQALSAPFAQREAAVDRGYAAAEFSAAQSRSPLWGLILVLLAVFAALFVRLRSLGKALLESNSQLEARVLQRTEELTRRYSELRTAMDNSGQAVFAVDAKGSISDEGSATVNKWLPHARAGMRIWQLLAPIDSDEAAWMEIGWEQLAQDIMPPSVVFSQLPAAFQIQGRHLRAEYREMPDQESGTARVLVVLSDISGRIEAQRREEAQQERFKVFQYFLHDRSAFLEFVADGDALVDTLRSDETDYTNVFRAVHTLKGTCGLFGVQSIADLCHELESELALEQDVPELARIRVCEAWKNFKSHLQEFAGEGEDGNTICLHISAMDHLRAAISQGAPAKKLLESISRMQREPVKGRLMRLVDHARTVARHQGKGRINIRVEDGGVRLNVARWSPFWAASVHLLRNAADHGLEKPRERIRAGKSELGTLTLRTRYAVSRVVIEFEDDGRGIDWDALRLKAERLGLIATNSCQVDNDREPLRQLLFSGGLSTKIEVTDTSGRGVGVSAAYAACRAMGGAADLESTPGQGTLFRFTIPDDDTVFFRNSVMSGPPRR